MELKVPTAVAVVLWGASGLCVLTYTYLAYKETAGGSHGHTATPGLSANPKVLGAQLLPEIKPLERNKFPFSNKSLKFPGE